MRTNAPGVVAAPRKDTGKHVVGEAREGRAAKAAKRTGEPRDRDGVVHELGAPFAQALGASEGALAFNPLLGIRRRDIAAAAASLAKVLASAPRSTAKHFRTYLAELRKIARGASDAAPDPKDRRFADPAWRTNFLYKALVQLNVATQQRLFAAIADAPLDPRNKERARFFVSLAADALAPSNWLLGNPAALRKILDTGGKHLVDGVRHLVHDVRHNGGLPSQVDARPFKLGENIATTRGQVVLRDEMFELLRFAPTTDRVHARPLLMSPPQINKYYAVDLAPEKSLIKWIIDSGVRLFVVSWRNPGLEHRHWGLDDYVLALDRAVEATRRITGSPDVNAWGSCAGGMTLAAYLGWLAGRDERKVAHTSWAVCTLDTARALEGTTLGLFNTPAAFAAARARSMRRGVVTGDEMARLFAWLRPNDLVWNYWVNNYLLGNEPPAFDILAWNSDTTRLPAQFHVDLLDLMEKNPFANPGTLRIGGVPVDLSRAQVGAYVIGGITDHITPWKGCYATARLLGGDSTFVLANAGHLQSLINPPGAGKSFFLAAPASVDDADGWAAGAPRQEGSWWPHWRAWIQERSGALVDAATDPHPDSSPLGAAPGTYVLER